MNTRASVAYGWGILCLAGGGAYYFAKRSINADREERAAAVEQRRQRSEGMRKMQSLEREAKASLGELEEKVKRAPNAEKLGKMDPAAVSHAGTEVENGHGGGGGDGSKFEANVPYRSRKGDRFS